MMFEKIVNKVKAKAYRHLPADEEYIKVQYKLIFKKDLDLSNPKTFNEKISWIICNYRNPLYELCSDKIAVRDYIASKGLAQHLTEIYATYDTVDEIDFGSLPESFVIKPSNSYGGVSVVTNKSFANFKNIKMKLVKSLSKNLYFTTREWQYKNLIPRIMAEEYIAPPKNKPLLDYKIYCFDGTPHYISVSVDVAKGGLYEMNFYDTAWNHLDLQRVNFPIGKKMKRPAELDQMLEVARTLSSEFPHVRVDLYNVNGKIYIGELTFTTAGGTGRFVDEKWDLELGEHFKLPRSGAEIIADRLNQKSHESIAPNTRIQ